MRGQAPGFPQIGRSVPALAVTAVGVVAGAVASRAVVGLSGWLVISLLLLLGAAALPRSPLAAVLTLQWGLALVLSGEPGYSGRFVVLLVAAHLLLAVGTLAAWLPFRARVQIAVLRRPAIRFVVVQAVAQAVAFGVLTFVSHGPSAASFVWLGIVGALAALALAALVLAPALLRPSR